MKKILFWGTATVFLFILIYFFLPVHIFKASLYFTAIVGAVLIAIGALLSITAIDAYIRERSQKSTEASDNIGCLIAVVFFVCLFGIGGLFVFREVQLEKQELEEHGVFVMAKIVDGYSYSSRRLDLTSLKVIFKMKDGRNMTQEVSISKNEFDRFYLNQEIPIVYSSRYPSINEVLRREEDLMKYLNPQPQQP